MAGGDGQLLSVLAAISANNGSIAVTLPVDVVQVTALKPVVLGAGPADQQGFFVQAGNVGLFVERDLTSLSPSPRIGDRVSFVVTQVSRLGNQRKATGLNSWVVHNNAPLTVSSRPLAGTDLAQASVRAQYESTLVSLTGWAGSWSTDGGGYGDVSFPDAGVPLALRMPVALNDSQDLRAGCFVTATSSPLSLNAIPQVYVWDAGLLTGTTCPPPQFVSVVADAGTALVTFSRYLDPATVGGPWFSLRDLNGSTIVPFVGTAFPIDRERVMLSGAGFTNGVEYELTSVVRDTRGLVMLPMSKITFTGGGCRGGALVISAVSFGSGAQWVELHNRSSASLSLSQYGLLLFDLGAPSYESLSALGPLNAGQFLLMRLSSTWSAGLPQEDTSRLGTTFSPTSGGVMLLSSGTNSNCGNQFVLDSVAWGTTTSNACSESIGLGTISNGNTMVVRRDTTRGCRDSNNNLTDFLQTGTFTPRNKLATAVSCLCP